MSAFPSSPADGDEFTLGDRVFFFDAALPAWRLARTFSSGATVVSSDGAQVAATTADFDPNPAIGALAYSEADSAMFIYDGSGYINPVTGTTVLLADLV